MATTGQMSVSSLMIMRPVTKKNKVCGYMNVYVCCLDESWKSVVSMNHGQTKKSVETFLINS